MLLVLSGNVLIIYLMLYLCCPAARRFPAACIALFGRLRLTMITLSCFDGFFVCLLELLREDWTLSAVCLYTRGCRDSSTRFLRAG